MTKLFKGGKVLNVFIDKFVEENLLVQDDRIVGIGDYTEADEIIDVSGKWIVPGFIDGHIHIESTMLTPYELSKVLIEHGTAAIVADPHEIANVCGVDGIKYMLKASEGLPMTVYIMLPSCVPATGFDEAGAVLKAEDLYPLYNEDRVLGLAEMMNYPGVIANDPDTMAKISDARKLDKIINGHAPLLSGKDLDKYIAAGISDDHECSTAKEAKERIRKGQWIMIRQGTAAHNLKDLLPLFKDPYNRRCLLVTDDKHPADLLADGHIDNIIRQAIYYGEKPEVALRMATLQAAQCFGLKWRGALAPGYRADIVVVDDLEKVKISEVYLKGETAFSKEGLKDFEKPVVPESLQSIVRDTFNLKELKPSDFMIEKKGEKCRVISVIPGQILTDEVVEEINFDENNGVDIERSIIKLAVVERHHNTGHIGLGYIKNLGLMQGAIAASVSHDSHNLIVAGADASDMALAANTVREMGGGCAVVCNGEVISEMPLPIAGLMTDMSAVTIADLNEEIRHQAKLLGTNSDIEPFMNLAFVSLPVIPTLKMSTNGLVNVLEWKQVPLFV